MELQQIDILLRLLLAHFLADFLFQTDQIAKEKKNGLSSKYFYIHILIVGALTYVFLANWKNPTGPIVIMIIHGIIDLWKSRIKKDNAWLFVVDQILHILTLIIFWLVITCNSPMTILAGIKEFIFQTKSLIVIIAYLFVSMPIGIFIGYLTSRWQLAIENNSKVSLKDAGKWIGTLERLLILTFILLNQWAAIGFLLAAKSVFRFGDLKDGKDHMKTEYILIGTLLSFTFSIAVGIMVGYLLQRIT